MSNNNYGGQAVLEGVMMRGKKHLAIAVRRQPEEIVMETMLVNSITDRITLLKLPILRGFVALLESLVTGVKALAYSANQVVEGVGEGETISNKEIALSVVTALTLGVGLFFLLPAGIAYLLEKYITNAIWQSAFEGATRIAIFLAYVWGISFLQDIQRVFQYHGAEHKVIYTYEAGEELTVENARKYSTLHPRCGTSFLLVVMVVSILMFSLLGKQTLLLRLASRLLLLPLVAGISYEFIKLSGKHCDNLFFKILSKPGMMLQKMTTREPDDSQLEVAITALNGVLDLEKEGPI